MSAILAKERRIVLPHVELAALEYGDSSLPPLLAIHGWLDNAASMAGLAALLAGERHIVAVDLPGHGRSAHLPPGQEYHLVDYLHDLSALLDALGWRRCDLLGHSLGAALSSMFAAAFPERVEQLLLVEGLGPLSRPESETASGLRAGLKQRRVVTGSRLRRYADLDSAVSARAQASGLTAEQAMPLVQRGTISVDGGLAWSSDPRLLRSSPLRCSEAQVADMLAAIRAPVTLVLGSTANTYMPPELFRQRVACLARVTPHTLPGNHHVHLQEPAAVARILRDALRGRRGDPGDPTPG